jgi:hypothetical protein
MDDVIVDHSIVVLEQLKQLMMSVALERAHHSLIRFSWKKTDIN